MSAHVVYRADSVRRIALRPRDAATALGISLSTLERLVRSGDLPVIKAGRVRIFSIESLQDWLRRKGGTDDPT